MVVAQGLFFFVCFCNGDIGEGLEVQLTLLMSLAHSHETDSSVLSKDGKVVSYVLNEVVLLLSRDHVD